MRYTLYHGIAARETEYGDSLEELMPTFARLLLIGDDLARIEDEETGDVVMDVETFLQEMWIASCGCSPRLK